MVKARDENLQLEIAYFLIHIGCSITEMIECLRHLENGVSFSESMKRVINTENKKHFCDYAIDAFDDDMDIDK